jgi:hypothetical protein
MTDTSVQPASAIANSKPKGSLLNPPALPCIAVLLFVIVVLAQFAIEVMGLSLQPQVAAEN